MELLPWEQSMLLGIDAEIKEIKIKIKIAVNYLKESSVNGLDTKFTETINNHPVWIITEKKDFNENDFTDGLIKLFIRESVCDVDASKILLMQKAKQTIESLKAFMELNFCKQYDNYYQNSNFEDTEYIIFRAHSLFEYLYLLSTGLICKRKCNFKSNTYQKKQDTEIYQELIEDYLKFQKNRINNLVNIKKFYLD
jgi:hypothetical protein